MGTQQDPEYETMVFEDSLHQVDPLVQQSIAHYYSQQKKKVIIKLLHRPTPSSPLKVIENYQRLKSIEMDYATGDDRKYARNISVEHFVRQRQRAAN